MGHDIHFLERLSRVGQTELELALSLYRDPGLVKAVLERAKLPDGAERIAVALSERAAGPHLVLARDGGFVTCLGEGMFVGDLARLERGQLDAIARHHDQLRERLSMVERLSGGDESKSNKLFGRIFNSGCQLSREEFLAITHFRLLALDGLDYSQKQLFRLLIGKREELRDIRKPHPKHEENLRTFWNGIWAVGHLALINFRDNDEETTRLAEELAAKEVSTVPAMIASELGVAGPFLRCLWAQARVGKIGLADAKRTFRSFRHPIYTYAALGSLMGIGLRQSRFRAEVLKVIERGPDFDGYSKIEEREFANLYFEPLLATAAQTLSDPDAHEAHLSAAGNETWTWLLSGLEPTHPVRVVNEAKQSINALMMGLMNDPRMLFRNQLRDTDQIALKMLPWVVSQEPEAFYFPKAQLEMTAEFEQHFVMFLLEAHRELTRRSPVAVEAKQSRNDLCVCGSGKKFKRCHGSGR